MPSGRTAIAVLVLALVLAGGFLGAQSAERHALAAEDEYVSDRLANASCLSDWDTGVAVVAERAAVTGPAVGGVRVNVTLPYSTTTVSDGVETHADAGSAATYVVTLTDVQRVRGDDVSPC